MHGLRRLLAAAVLVAPLAAPVAMAGAAHAAAPAVRIRDIQGTAHISPLNGSAVARVPGVVTALTGNGFWMQDPRPDKDDATAEGVFVFTRTRPDVAVGDSVRVDGEVAEFRPGGGSSGGLTRTEIGAGRITVEAHGAPLPAPVVVGAGGRRAPGQVIDRAHGNVERGGAFDPRRDGIDFYESLEGMRIEIRDAVAVGPSRHGEIPVLPAGGAGAGPRTERGGILLRPGDWRRVGDANPERVILDDALAPLPGMNVGDRLPGANHGVLDYGYGAYHLLLTATPRREAGELAREATRPQRRGELAVATARLDGLNPATPPARFTDLAGDIVTGLRSPDLITISGLGDNSGPDDDGTVTADQTVAQLITSISAAGGPAYDWRSVTPRDNADGGEEGDNRRNGFLFRTDRGLAFVDRPSLTDPLPEDPPEGPDPAVTAVEPVRRGGTAGLSLSPGRIAPGDAAWAGTRKPVAGELTWQGHRIIVIANQWFPRTTQDQPFFGRNQPPSRPTLWRRDAQARVVAGFVRSVQKVDRNAKVIVAGELNDPETSAPVRTLSEGTGLKALAAGLPPGDRYTAISDGNSEVLDHILLSPSLRRNKHEFDVVHRNAEFAGHPDDRDPAVVRIAMPRK
ncbi:endonuclease/exonuclease/phosphatase [Actinomadura sp. 7K507]|uniref:endonuclease/exonuclease/phosphatase n=1 Tax=Actinomadura sp. 7K507 TaxID=2530365 RepID=UPI00104B9BBB|nr:endonuclease/exonuclease/phosphatase [Actinomadura sp. 7K507]TDC89263.1 endonuclease/exonuclease/phosphatase [Actinomadura sp. 7K507]